MRGPGPVLAQLARLLARDVSAMHAHTVNLSIEAHGEAGDVAAARVHRQAPALPARKVARLEHLVLRLGGTLSIQDEAPFELRINLPATGLSPGHKN